MKIKLLTKSIKCKRCGHEWIPRKTEVIRCAKCKSPYFDGKNEAETLDDLAAEQGVEPIHDIKALARPGFEDFPSPEELQKLRRPPCPECEKFKARIAELEGRKENK